MAEPTKKAPEIDSLITGFIGRSRIESIKADTCILCGKPATEFKDDLSTKEYTISGMCQECQDKTFGEAEPEPEVDIGVGVITLQRPAYGYCVMKCLRDLNNKKYAHLPMFCTVEEHGVGNPVTLRTGNGNEICQLGWDEFKKVYVMD